jgi:hypothetical protein
MPVDQPVRAWERYQYYDSCSQDLRARSGRGQSGADGEPAARGLTRVFAETLSD